MSRVIKFRAYLSGKHREKGGSVMECAEPKMEENVVVCDGSYAWVKDNGWDSEKIKGVYPTVPLMQFTGLTDRDGTDIYEGDICLVPNDKYDPSEGDSPTEITEVCYQNGRFVLKGDEYHDLYDYWEGDEKCGDCRVIGNVHQNPELLTESK